MFFRHRSLLASRSARLTKAPRRKKFRGLHRSGRLANDFHTQLGVEQLEERRMLAAVSVSTTNDLLNGDTTSIADLIANDGGDGISLREAITAANNTGGLDNVEFNIAGGGVQTIQPDSALPIITDAIFIDGYTQPGASPNTNDTSSGLNTVLTIELDGTNAGAGAVGLSLFPGSDGSTIRGLAIGNFNDRGIFINESDNNIIAGNFIGVAPNGVTPRGNSGVGVFVDRTSNSLIGGLTPEARNLISGNEDSALFIDDNFDVTVQGNLIGTNAAGTSAIPNMFEAAIIVIDGAIRTLIGHPSDTAGRNVISGNEREGVLMNAFDGLDNTVFGNYIGTDVTGLQPLGNLGDGIFVDSGRGITIGGPGDAGNLIAFNQGNGIKSSGGSYPIEGNTIRNNNENGILVLSSGNRITRNSIHNNVKLGIDLGDEFGADGPTPNDPQGFFIVGDPLDTDEGPNRLQNFPTFIDDVYVSGGSAQISYSVLSTPPESTFPLTIEFFLADDENQEGQTFLGADTYNYIAPGGQPREFNLAPAVPITDLVPTRMIVATATDLNGNTSEFSFPASIVLGSPPPDNPGGQPGGPGENDTIETSTLLGSEPEITLSARIQTQLPLIEDIDFYKYTANSTGKLIVNALFDHDGGDIDLQIVDMNGNLLGESATTTDNERAIIPVVGQEMYFIRLAAGVGADTVVNQYTLEIENFATPVPTGVHLDPASDTGMSNSDNLTSDTTPTFFIQTDVLEFVDANGNGLADAEEIAVLTAAEADAGVSAGIAVELTLVNTTDGTFVRGFADPVISLFPEVYNFTPAGPLTPGTYLVTARTMIFDGQGDEDEQPTPAMGRSGPSEPLWFTIDDEADGGAGVSAELLTSSDTGMLNNDNVTSKMQPAFQGVAPAGHKVRLYANGELVGQTVAGSDSSDVGIGGVDGLGGAPDDGLGLWEITVEPLADNAYDITLEIEDSAGNVFTFDPMLSGDDEPIDVWIDTAVPNTPLLDLLEASDSGRSDTDNITLDNTPTFLLIGDDTVGGVDNPFPNDLKYRLYDRPGTGTGEVLIFDSFTAFGDFVTFGQITFTSGTLDDGVHNFKLEVEDRAGNISPDFLLTVVFDTVDPPVSFGLPTDNQDGLAGGSDTGVATMPMTFTDRITSDSTPSFWGRAEADAIVQLFLDTDFNGQIDLGTDVLLGGTVALPFDGNDAFPDGFWEIDSLLDLNSITGLPQDGLRQILVTAEDVAGNPSVLADAVVDQLDIFLDTQGPRVNDVYVTDDPAYDLFDPKPSVDGPTPLVRSITIDFVDQPNRLGPDFLYDALKADIATSPGNYLLVGDHVGIIAIDSVTITPAPVVDGAPATASVTLTFAQPLPDDRFTLTISDNLVDPAGNRLDGESNANEPLEDPTFPSGNGLPGGDFTARFTIDTRPEIGSFIAQGINLDINGNFVWDPANAQIGNDATNVDLTFTLPEVAADGTIASGGLSPHDLVFTGKFRPPEADGAPGRLFDQLAAYGNFNGTFRWLIDTDSDGVVTQGSDIVTTQPLLGTFDVQGALPIAGEFNDNPDDGDEIGLYNQGVWILDSNHDFVLDPTDTRINSGLFGHPIVGDFDGNDVDDLAVFNNNVFSFSMNLGAGPNQTMIWGFPGVLDRPVAADMDQDGIDDIGLWVPRNGPNPSEIIAEWYFLVSNTFDVELQATNYNTVNLLTHGFSPPPFGADLFAEFGDELALPIVGNFDPPVTQSVPDPDDQIVEDTADFDVDGDVDGFDFLAWQRGYGNADAGASLADGDANADGAVDSDDLSTWQAQFGAVLQVEATAALLVVEQEVLAPLVVETASADLSTSMDAGQAALARIGGLDLASQQVGSQQAHARVAAADEAFGQWPQDDHSILRRMHRHRHIHHQARSHGQPANYLSNRHREDAQDIALESEGLEMGPFDLQRLWRG